MGYLEYVSCFLHCTLTSKKFIFFPIKLGWYLYVIYLKIPMSLSKNMGIKCEWIFMFYIVCYFAEFGLGEYYRIWTTTTKARIVAAYNGLFSTDVPLTYCQHKHHLLLMVHLGNGISMQSIYEVNSTSWTDGTVGHLVLWNHIHHLGYFCTMMYISIYFHIVISHIFYPQHAV